VLEVIKAMITRKIAGIFIAAVLAASTVLALAGASFARDDDSFVWGTVRMDNGFYLYTRVYPISIVGDQFFEYWAGESEGRAVLFDSLGQIWYPAPVQYERTKIIFRWEELEGFVRVWGNTIPFIDGNYFFGIDGMTYKLVKKYKRTGPAGNRHRKLKYSYYENMVTGERSDWPPRTDEEAYYYQSLIRESAKEAFPNWYSEAEPGKLPPSTEPLDVPLDEAAAEALEPEDGEAAGEAQPVETAAESEEAENSG